MILGFKHFFAPYFVSCNSHKVVILIQQINVLPWSNVQYDYSTNKWRMWRYSSIHLLQLPHFEQLRGMWRSSIASWSFHHLLPALQRFGRYWKLIKRQSKWRKGTSHSSIILVVSIMFGNGKIEISSPPIQFNSPQKSNVGIFALHEKLHGGEGMCGSKGLSFKHVLYSKPTSCWILVTVCHNHLKKP